MDSLADSKSKIAEIKLLILEKDETIERLRKKLKVELAKNKPKLKGNFYQWGGDDSLYCTGCLDKNMQKICTPPTPLVESDRTCPSCKITTS